VKGKWVVWRDGSTGEREYYEMDPVGRLVGGPANFSIHHTERPAPAIAPTVTEAAYAAPKAEQGQACGFDGEAGAPFDFAQWSFYEFE
jgi:hypothetical protein